MILQNIIICFINPVSADIEVVERFKSPRLDLIQSNDATSVLLSVFMLCVRRKCFARKYP